MGSNEPGKPSAALIIGAVAAIVLPAAAVGYLVTTFLFAFSGGQNRMVAVVNLGCVVVIGLGVVLAAIAWRLRSPVDAIKWSAIATGAGWFAVVIAEWLISFRLGAS
jgi:hypothetical protein